ncbi:hypothetical protein N7510_008859 [Penicillium lagena]|uniref:uncharacterized protein n=1 Tax=Penicillium lagena TaxID=94218 RepID=UPI002541A8D6|nr:uncharacterized protein N7510_008859 [Penicillium lagena]KAJ5606078.1 hypothetical protein N7510_008859 [Penicillium lagena]
MTNPYEADPKEIPATDLYADVPFMHVNSQTTDSLKYWASVLSLCTRYNRIYPADDGGRDVFALGSVIVTSSHLHAREGAQYTEIDFSYADANEVRAIALAKTVLKDVKVPEIYFAGKVLTLAIRYRPQRLTSPQVIGSQVLVQERLPGVGLSVAWPYLPSDQKRSYKEQARKILQQLHSIKPTAKLQARSYVVPDPNILSNGRIHLLEGDILFSGDNRDLDMSFTHNDFTVSNCIVDNGKISGLIDWEMAGFFGWKTAGGVHHRIRTPQREHFVNANLSKEQLQDMMFWNDLYEEGMPEN